MDPDYERADSGPDEDEGLSEAIRARRRERKLTQEELAKAAGVSPSYIAHIEVGRRRPSLEILTRIGDALDDAHLVTLRRSEVARQLTAPQSAPSAEATRPEYTDLFTGRVDRVAVDDHDGHTLAGAAVAAAVADAVASGPTVLAVRCERGHPNPLYAQSCLRCGSPISADPPAPMPRPSLGRLHASDFDIELTRGVILGRTPDHGYDDLGESPSLVRIRDEPTVSRSHLQVTLDGWVVLARDLGSANGTLLTQPGEPPVRMMPKTYYVLQPGAELSLAEEVSLTFEVSDTEE